MKNKLLFIRVIIENKTSKTGVEHLFIKNEYVNKYKLIFNIIKYIYKEF